MGCDIHLHQEVKIDGEWHYYGEADVTRWYALFSKMAGVRNYLGGQEPIDQPRGIPEDCSLMTKVHYERWGSDAHSASWLNADEIAHLEQWVEENGSEIHRTGRGLFGWLFGTSWGEFAEEKQYCEPVEDIRFVFWFDN